MTTKKGSKSCRGTDLKVGDKVLGFGIVTQASPVQQLKAGAKFVDVTCDGVKYRCWEGFNYHVECDVVMTLENSTPLELMEMD